MGKIKGKLLYLVSEDWYFCSHRLPLAHAAKKQGYDIVVVTQVTEHVDVIRAEGFKLIPIYFQRSFRRPWKDVITLISILKVYLKEGPDIIHQVSLKPVVYGSLAALIVNSRRLNPTKIINALTGLGFVFISNDKSIGFLRSIIKCLLRFLFHRKYSHLIVQNSDDMRMLIEDEIVNRNQVSLIRGSGVDIQIFSPNHERPGVVSVMLVARMLRDKGVEEFVTAAAQLMNQGIKARFILVGDTDNENPSAIATSKLEQWQSEGIIEWWGKREDMVEVYKQAHIVVLPSYREGLPKVLLEAAACGLPIVATDVPGCREIVNDGENGLLIPAKNSDALAGAIYCLIIDPKLRKEMGTKGRSLVEKEFSSDKIINETLALYDNLLNAHAD